MTDADNMVRDSLAEQYKYGFVTDIESETAPKGLTEDVVRWISAKKKRARIHA